MKLTTVNYFLLFCWQTFTNPSIENHHDPLSDSSYDCRKPWESERFAANNLDVYKSSLYQIDHCREVAVASLNVNNTLKDLQLGEQDFSANIAKQNAARVCNYSMDFVICVANFIASIINI